LVKQLKFEGFSKKMPNTGLRRRRRTGKKQSALKAQEYLDISAFSRQGLIKQLKYEGFTDKQAEYGVDQVGL
jgi:Host cell surface-exposed lipoprotein